MIFCNSHSKLLQYTKVTTHRLLYRRIEMRLLIYPVWDSKNGSVNIDIYFYNCSHI